MEDNIRRFWSGYLRTWRFLCEQCGVVVLADLERQHIFAYMEHRLEQGIKAATINSEFSHLRRFLGFLEERGQPICTRLLRVQYLDSPRLISKDIPPAQLRILQTEIQRVAESEHGLQRRYGR